MDLEHRGLLQSDELYKYILETNVYPREPEPLKEIRALTGSHQLFFMGTSPDAGQMIEMLLKLTGAKKTLEIGVYTGYSLLLTALAIPEDGKVNGIIVYDNTLWYGSVVKSDDSVPENTKRRKN
ncbi:hypothetical protein E3N88_09685 [Mikania micrantha]|uniref:Uncharacterized protein n=1 Tax=Mikania micrantha TaxID=192012 RepID=A0A5N6PJQ8_9ASTR|nr:hypothetical protein E3N88_09685 [Mikania micrantha]